MLDTILSHISQLPMYLDIGAKYIGYASMVAAVTPFKWDNKAVSFVGSIVNALALNMGNAKNVMPKKESKFND